MQMKRLMAKLVVVGLIAVMTTGCQAQTPKVEQTKITANSTWECPSCGTSNNSGKYCSECGSENVGANSWKCSNCGATASGNFCTECGTAKSGKPTTTSAVTHPTMTEAVTHPTDTTMTEAVTQPTTTSQTTAMTEEVTSANTEAPVLSNATGTVENTANIGDWLSIDRYNPVNEEYETVNFRITDVIRGDAAMKYINEYNDSGAYVKLQIKELEGTEPCVIVYDVHFPNDWTDEGRNISCRTLQMSPCGLDGGSLDNGTMWLMQMPHDISDRDSKCRAGDTLVGNKTVASLFTGSSDYLIKVHEGSSVLYVKGI